MDLVAKPFNLRQCVEETIDLVLVKPITPKSFNQIDVVYILAPSNVFSSFFYIYIYI
jgi:hypothetical protein